MLAFALLGLCATGVLGASVNRRQIHVSASDCYIICLGLDDPVCASNHQTYRSKCHMESASCDIVHDGGSALTVLHNGPCNAARGRSVDALDLGAPDLGSLLVGAPDLPDLGTPVVGAPLDPYYAQAPSGTTHCDDICDEDVRHICASDGNVYQNVCLFQRAQCEAAKNGIHLSIVAVNDTCPKPRAPDCAKYHIDTSDVALEGVAGVQVRCPSTYHYVCGTDGRSYSNECHMCQHMETVSDAALMIQYDGHCHSDYGYIGGFPIDQVFPVG